MQILWLTISQSCYLSKSRRWPSIPHSYNLRCLPHCHKPWSLAHDHTLQRLIPTVGWRFWGCDAAKTLPSGANSSRTWGRQRHLRCWCGSVATWRFDRWRQSPWSPSPRCLTPPCPTPWCPSPRRPSPQCPSPRGAPWWLGRRGLEQCSGFRRGNGCCVRVRVGFLFCEIALLDPVHLRNWLRHWWRCLDCLRCLYIPAGLG